MAALRRDRILFAVTGALIVIASYFQPLAEANAAGTAHAWIVCTEFGAARAGPDAPGGALPAADDCPKCIAGTCQPPAPVKALAAGGDPVRLALPEPGAAMRPATAETAPPGPPPALRSIRAPPLPV